jgi:hypothetical protein
VALERQSLLAVAKELRQVAVAVSLMGTRRWRMLQFTKKLRPIRDELVWLRPDVRKLRSTIARAIHNMERGREDGRQAKNMRSAADAIDELLKLQGREPLIKELEIGGVRFNNAWGFSARDLMPVMRRYRKVAERLEDLGLKELTEVEVIVNPDESPMDYAIYSVSDDVIYLNPKRARKADADLLEAFGDRIWVTRFDSKDKQTWGKSALSAWSRFTKAWVGVLDGKRPDPDTAARLAVTVGQMVGPERWEKAVA